MADLFLTSSVLITKTFYAYSHVTVRVKKIVVVNTSCVGKHVNIYDAATLRAADILLLRGGAEISHNAQGGKNNHEREKRTKRGKCNQTPFAKQWRTLKILKSRK